ncbi:hypothetical protein [Anthocerotibacter panamensis]|uniref:hypothetical protein n=1 Tax=Anthocerotibacter panamensis TaxID=2857077 RepID=UPI001C4066BD|nr:hypothetical protein [Anthocerotibacter panamensis]
MLGKRRNLGLDAPGYNQLNELGNEAIRLGLIVGHGYRGGKYEILQQGEAMLFSPQQAQTYLQDLITREDQT